MRNSSLEPYIPAIPESMSMVVGRLLFTPLGPDQPGCASGGALTDPTHAGTRFCGAVTVFMHPVDHILV